MTVISTSPCTRCGACCAYSAEWPRFTLETDEDLAKIPEALVDGGLGRMRWDGSRCAALEGTVADCVSCSIYTIRPIVCRDCVVGDEACTMARAHHGLAPLPLEDV